MTGGAPRQTAWIVAPPELCVLCRNPIGSPSQASSWNGSPAHRDCVRIHMLNRDPAFRDWQDEPASSEAPADEVEDMATREDEDDAGE